MVGAGTFLAINNVAVPLSAQNLPTLGGQKDNCAAAPEAGQAYAGIVFGRVVCVRSRIFFSDEA